MDQLPPDSQAATASQFTPSAFAVPVPSAIGATASAPAKVARPIVLRMFFNFFPFDERAPPSTRAVTHGRSCLYTGLRWGRPISVRGGSRWGGGAAPAGGP